jgi:ribosomal protein L29
MILGDKMDYNKLKSKEIRALDTKKIHTTANSLRKELVGYRMDVYNAGPQSKTKSRNLRKTLARLLTIGTEKQLLLKKNK